MTTDKIRKEKNQNIQVFIRLRPLNQREKDIKSLGVIEVVNNREVVVRQSQQTSHTKKFTFDRAFGPNANQLQVYQEVVSPLIEEVLNGYNCTVFAYGQTGTGKTHTMVGEHSDSETTWQNDPLAGIIPRALSQLFDELRLTNTEYTVRVSYLELYNEELFDLLGSEDNSKLRIYEDVTRKGSNIVNGLEEITVYNKNEVYKIMAQGQERKRVASTLMNAQSSRSHTVFTIVVHMKENSPEGEELVKIGKLNLVDLAGSENISKAGSDNPAKKERARECVNINQSLLTLGRVITALVERHPHIPYRESKLTRILQESLGGRTKTSIIATISPGHKDLEETMSTLEYAHRAKNIQNKPEVNQKMTKKAILKEYAEEIDRLKRDLQAARDKNGVYLASETFAEMTLKQEEQRKEIQELLLKKRAMEEERDRMESVFQEMNQQLETRNTELQSTRHILDSTKAELATTTHKLVATSRECEEQRYLVSAHCSTEAALTAQARALLHTAETASRHVACLHDTVDRRKSVECSNLEATRTYRSESRQQRGALADGLSHYARAVSSALQRLQHGIDSYNASNIETQEQNKEQLERLAQSFFATMNEIKSATSASQATLEQSTLAHKTSLHASVEEHNLTLQNVLSTFLQNLCSAVEQARAVDVKGNVASFVQQWYVGASARVWSLQRAHGSFCARHHTGGGARAALALAQREGRQAHVAKRAGKLAATMQEMEAESARLQERLNAQLNDVASERTATVERLNAWAERERASLEQRLAEHMHNEKQALEERLSKKMAEIEEQQTLLQERMDRLRQWQQMQTELDREELALAEEDLQESENGRVESENELKKYNKEFEEGADAVSVDLEVFSKNVVEVVDHVCGEMLRALDMAKGHVQEQVTQVIQTDEQTCATFTQAAGAALDHAVHTTRDIVHSLVDTLETTNNKAVQDISNVAASLSSLISLSRSTQAIHAEQTASAQSEASEMSEKLNAALERHAELEETYLDRKYRIYSPTGATPARAQYRVARALAATEPHERLLTRRAASLVKDHVEEDCIVIDSEPESPLGSSTHSLVFAAPSPPLPIAKCTSETDIYAMRRQQEQHQGKENSDLQMRSVSHKKPSKLPAPSSMKKPLVERNVN